MQRLATTDGDDRDPKCVSSQFRKLYFSSTAIPPERFLVGLVPVYLYAYFFILMHSGVKSSEAFISSTYLLTHLLEARLNWAGLLAGSPPP